MIPSKTQYDPVSRIDSVDSLRIALQPKKASDQRQTRCVMNVRSYTDNNHHDNHDLPESLAYDLKYLNERIQRLEKKRLSRRKSTVVSVANDGDDGDKAIDGTCSGNCAKYFVDLVSIVGIKEISRAKHPLIKVMWCITFIISVCITIFYLIRVVESYIAEPTATKVKIVRQEKYDYPVMVLCPDVWLDFPKALRLGATVGAVQYALGYLINYYFRAPPYQIINYEMSKVEFESWYVSRNYSNLVEMFKDITTDSEIFLYKCPYCAYKNFSKVLMDEGVCYKIPMEWMSGKGTARSATDILEVTVPDLSGGLLHKKKYWKFYVEPEMSIGISTVRFVQVFPGFSNTIRFTPVRYLSISTPDNPCVHAEPGYSPIGCALNCANQEKRCRQIGATRPEAITRNLSEICHYYPQYFWFLHTSIKLEQKLVDTIPEHCFKKCPPPCERWMYEASVESHKISSYVPPPPSNITDSKNLEPVPMTRIYLLNQAPLQGGYLEFKEVSTYSFDDLIGSIGGIMALWLGVSIMSFIQIAVFFITWCFARHLNKRNNLPTKLDEEMTISYVSNGGTY